MVREELLGTHSGANLQCDEAIHPSSRTSPSPGPLLLLVVPHSCCNLGTRHEASVLPPALQSTTAPRSQGCDSTPLIRNESSGPPTESHGLPEAPPSSLPSPRPHLLNN
ncbi:hypothetical protein MRB53_034452 [Persea americana]|uniref:Uncharacterized protein n=1 Tax=Persea americana TaxID=3435 RepID=A0ACC2K1U3_PERAE|nr:hypothetical protein MRB53_034452 [Persea americana]